MALISSTGSPIKDQSISTAGPPLDYSFKELKSVTDLLYEEPASGVPRNRPIPRDVNANEYLDSLDTSAPRSPSNEQEQKHAKLNANSVRVCNNFLYSLKNLDRVMWHLLDPKALTWLDASCNQITSIDECILQFPSLQVLYLHGNQIGTFLDCLKLAQLHNLRKLTLHGCPVSEKQNYKMQICAHLPQLRSLDFSTITKVDRDKVETWYAAYKKQKARES
ncbi:flagellar associated protein [Dunaliella salina]|uniref:Flagellar associated protein n=1 Tax=Dunaliella salina TaxID=3046 RepID=A0ABQ7GY27_DUNSA|nr:flagellar associated protein [Dunaliella salina]|eukprot:KAF5839503.1 flagellar associated protein [Dunaliella salina]